MDESCTVCGGPVRPEVVEKLAEWSVAPICSMECVNVAAVLLEVELRVAIKEWMRSHPSGP